MASAALRCLLPFLPLGLVADDWPQFLGPTRSGVSSEAVATNFASSGPATLWKATVGEGFSGPVVAGGTAFLFHRSGDDDVLQAWEAASGKPLWRHTRRATYSDDFGRDNGPRATPCVDDGRVFALDADGFFACVSAADGKQLWAVDVRREFRADKGFFGFACSPLVEGELVLVNIGGQDGAGIAAWNKRNGQLAWKANDHEASYSSPVVATVDGQRRVLFFTRSGLVALDPSNGKVAGEFPWRARMHASVNAASPVVTGDRVFISTCYDVGAALLRVKAGSLEKLWNEDDLLSAHFATPVQRDGFLFGFDGRQEQGPGFRCVSLDPPRVAWRKDDVGSGLVLLARNALLLLLESGELIVVEPSTTAFTPLARAQVLGTGGRAAPALANGRLYARDKRQLVCFDLRAGKKE